MAPSQQQQPEQFFKINLSCMGVESKMMDYLLAFISFNHPGEQERIYHNLNHTLEVANLFLAIISQFGLENKWKVLGFLAGLLHDLDPERVPNTPPSVERTIQFLDGNNEIKAIIDWFCENFGFTVGQLKTLILATDYDSNPEKRVDKWNIFVSECEIHFQGEFFSTKDYQSTNLGLFLGKILAYSDKLATYIQPINIVVNRVKGLALELRTLLNSDNPTEEYMLIGTGNFQREELKESELFNILPEKYKRLFIETYKFFTEVG